MPINKYNSNSNIDISNINNYSTFYDSCILKPTDNNVAIINPTTKTQDDLINIRFIFTHNQHFVCKTVRKNDIIYEIISSLIKELNYNIKIINVYYNGRKVNCWNSFEENELEHNSSIEIISDQR